MTDAMASSPSSMIKVNVQTTEEAIGKVSISAVSQTITVGAFKRRIQADVRCQPDLQRLIYRGRILEDSETFAQCGLCDGSTLHFVRSGGSAPPAAPSAAPASPFGAAGMGGGGGLPDMASMQQQLTQNPEMMRQMMDSPMMRSMTENPDMLRLMLESNPQLQAMMDSNPQMRQVLDDPATLRQAMQAMRDPSHMRNMQRQQELAMSQIENHPGGFQHIRRAYEEVQAPLEEATSGFGAEPNGSSSRAQPVSHSGPLPNPWATAPAPSSPLPPAAMTPPVGGGAGGNLFNPLGMLGGSGPGGSQGQQQPTMQQMATNPMMQQMLSDPASMQAMMQHPMVQQMAANNPQMAQHMQRMTQNPQMLQQAMQAMQDPNMQSMMQSPVMQQQMQQMMNGMGGAGGGAFGGGAFPALLPTLPAPHTPVSGGGGLGSIDLAAIARQLNVATIRPAPAETSGPPQAAAAAPSSLGASLPSEARRPAAERFATQESTLQAMGFTDTAANITALAATEGNVNAAVERLLS
eukprot:CAMPEP_0171984108 /NCGR_PEP_ID=MMETSP0993-20121228/273654_1 /TAXON_ID=483369 /ORGANISM="non described non described, Strain CCMP2098" /LENGTH=519 /DNA_ID=CAMNT_0012636913 /DNA_START=10 /DNA_END=1569 /DNA_ORIENTATION=-